MILMIIFVLPHNIQTEKNKTLHMKVKYFLNFLDLITVYSLF